MRPATASDVPALPAIELAALALFEAVRDELALGSLGRVNREADFRAALHAGRLWVAADEEDRPVGFALADEIDGCGHLDELDVLPDHGRRGLGSALIGAVCDWARSCGYPALTLSTFRAVSWNAPYYERLGFRGLAPDELGPGLRQLVEEERAKGLSTDRRVMMRRDL